MKLQVLVNKVLRLLTGLDRDTPVSILSASSGKLSVQQRTAFFTINSVYRILRSTEPANSYSVLKPAINRLMIFITPQTVPWSTTSFLYPDKDTSTGGVDCIINYRWISFSLQTKILAWEQKFENNARAFQILICPIYAKLSTLYV